jgi:hypothetical protein
MKSEIPSDSEIKAFIQNERSAAHCDLRRYAASMFTIRRALGQEWINRNREQLGFDDPPPRRRFQTTTEELTDALRRLRGVPGIERQLLRLQSEDLETVLCELVIAVLFLEAGLPFRFVTPVGKKQCDYDAEVEFGGRVFPCEIKLKERDTTPSGSGVFSVLEKARKQLPQGVSGIVAVKVPESFLKTETLRSDVVSAIQKRLRQTTRIAAVILHWDVFTTFGERYAQRTMYRVFVGEQAPAGLAELEAALQCKATSTPSLASLVCSPGVVSR